jgi:hypothetical protein
MAIRRVSNHAPPVGGWDVAGSVCAARPAIADVYASGNSVDHCRAFQRSISSKLYRVSDIFEACLILPENAAAPLTPPSASSRS